MRLANGQGWHIVATEGAASWVERLAGIMELRECGSNGYPRILFVGRHVVENNHRERVSDLHPQLRRRLPANGWEPQDLVWLQVWSHRAVPDIICAVGFHEGKKHEILQMRMALQPIYQRIQDLGGLPLHAALVERNGFGILLAAQGGTGKTTCCRRLPSPWRALSDDEALVVRDNNQGYLVHPFPTWSDYLLKRSTRTWHIQNYLPTSAIFFLEQAEADEVVTVGQGQGAALVYQSATQVCARHWINLNNEKLSMLRKRLFENCCDLAQRTPIFRLRLSLEGKFWEEIEAILEESVRSGQVG